ncbi:MAG: substrate-binding domain-containing protein [Chloroflexota bacterium]
MLVKSRPNDTIVTNGFYSSVLSGIESVCRQRQINLLYANLPVDENNVPLEIPRLLTEQQADGILLVGMHLDQTMMGYLQNHSTSVVLVDSYAANDSYDVVITDNQAGAYQATSHLVQQGHKNIALVGSLPDAFPSIQERRQGYIQAIEKHALTPHFIDCPLDHRAAEETTLVYLQENPQITALFGSNDRVAIAAMQAAQSLGLDVPRQLSVIGFDNIPAARYVTPGLSTMRVDKMGMGRIAAQMLINRIEYPESANVCSVIRPHLIERQSVGAATLS